MKTNQNLLKGMISIKVSGLSLILLFFSSFSPLLGLDLDQPVQTLNPSGFRETTRVLVGKTSIKVTPLREYTLKAGSTGLIELYVPAKPDSYKLGDRLGGVDTTRLQLDQELMDLSESMLKEKEIPQWHLQRKSQIDQLDNQLSKIEGERSLTQQMLKNPEKYKELFQSSSQGDGNHSEDLARYLNELSLHEVQIKDMLGFLKSDRKEELELGELKKKFELRKLQFEMRLQQAYLTVPFDSEVEFLFPYVKGEKNYIQAGMEVALLRDLRELHGQVPILDPDWRLLKKGKLELEIKSSTGLAIGKYLKSVSKEISGGEELIYSFKFELKDNLSLRNQLGGRTEGKLYYKLARPARMVPKFLLVSLAPEIFRSEGWHGLVEKLCPEYELLHVGLYSIAIAPTVGL
jgi:hypothetical protein